MGTFSAEAILSQCPHWSDLTTEQAQWVLNQLPRFYQIFRENCYLPEESFSILQERPGIDNCPRVKGKFLNNCVTNRQRCLLLGNNLQYHRELRQEALAELNTQKTRTKCIGCSRFRLQSEPAWRKCTMCRVRCCNLNACFARSTP